MPLCLTLPFNFLINSKSQAYKEILCLLNWLRSHMVWIRNKWLGVPVELCPWNRSVISSDPSTHSKRWVSVCSMGLASKCCWGSTDSSSGMESHTDAQDFTLCHQHSLASLVKKRMTFTEELFWNRTKFSVSSTFRESFCLGFLMKTTGYYLFRMYVCLSWCKMCIAYLLHWHTYCSEKQRIRLPTAGKTSTR